jgi:UDP-galactopyranose mutase
MNFPDRLSEVRGSLPPVPLLYTGPIDRYFDFRAGRLGWRTLDFEREVVEVQDYQGTAVMNYADLQVPYTRIHEFRHLHPERRNDLSRTVICREYSRYAMPNDEPYYPICTPADLNVLELYRTMAAKQKNMLFGGRLGTYRYIDMHETVAAALAVFRSRIAPYFQNQKPICPTTGHL